jgi:hypothetical protein
MCVLVTCYIPYNLSSVIVHLYAVEDDLSDWIFNLHLPKPFLKTTEVLNLLEPDGKITINQSTFELDILDLSKMASFGISQLIRCDSRIR